MKKIFLFLAIFSLGAFFLGIILKKLEHGRVKSVKFGGSKIYNFILVNKNHNKLYFKGKKAIETGESFKVFYLNGYIEKQNKKTYISSKKATLDKRNKKVILYENVNINSSNINLNTKKLNIDLEKHVAYGNDFCKITTENSKTLGKEVFINLEHEILKLKHVKTIIER